jgi:hypothetical protein
MTKKLIFTLLLSGVILSPMGAYAMNEHEEPTAPGVASSSRQPNVAEQVAPDFKYKGYQVSAGEHLLPVPEGWVNKARTIFVMKEPDPTNPNFIPVVIAKGKKEGLLSSPIADTPEGRQALIGMNAYMRRHPGMSIDKFPGLWIGPDYAVEVDAAGGLVAFPITSTTPRAPTDLERLMTIVPPPAR